MSTHYITILVQKCQKEYNNSHFILRIGILEILFAISCVVVQQRSNFSYVVYFVVLQFGMV